MASIFGWPKTLYTNFVDDISSRISSEIGNNVAKARNWRLGRQPSNLRLKPGQYDDNVTINLDGLVVNRNVSQLVGKGLTFKFPGEGDAPSAQGVWLAKCLDANHQEILFHRAALAAAESGTGYFVLLAPPVTVVGEDGLEYPRILVWDPAFVTIKCQTNDWEIVLRYTHEYYAVEEGGSRVGYRQVIKRDMGQVDEVWTIQDFIMRIDGRWEETTPEMLWPWHFCPVTHWQNLPAISDPYGIPDMTDDLYALQNSINADASSLSKNIRLMSNPLKWGKGSTKPDKIDTGPDMMPWLGPDGEIHVEPAIGDLLAARALLDWKKAVFMNISRTVDINSLTDKLGSITNFALRVIYQDNVSKIDTKRELFGDALEELARKLQIMNNFEPLPADVVWPDFVPVNVLEAVQTEQAKMDLGVESEQTATETLGLNWKQEQDRKDKEAQSGFNRLPVQ